MSSSVSARATDRDFRGYGASPPAIRWPNDARLAVSVVVNVEEGAELSLGAGDEANEFIYEAVERIEGSRDLCMESHYEYGTRRGWPRIRKALAERGIAATLNACGRAIALSPWLAEEAVADGHEISCHGWRWERHVAHAGGGRTPGRYRRGRSRRISAAAGTRAGRLAHPLRRRRPTRRRLLVEEGGFLYDCDAYSDDLPFMGAGRATATIVVLPYSLRHQRHALSSQGLGAS